MIILFSSSLGIMAVKRLKERINYTDMLIYIGKRISLLMTSTLPETEEIMTILKTDSRLKNFDFNLKKAFIPLEIADKERVLNFFADIGLYNSEDTKRIADEFSGYFGILKEQYQEYYNSHYRLYIIFGVFIGILVSVLLI